MPNPRIQPPQEVLRIFVAVLDAAQDQLKQSGGKNKAKIVQQARQELKRRLKDAGLEKFAGPQTKALKQAFADPPEAVAPPK